MKKIFLSGITCIFIIAGIFIFFNKYRTFGNHPAPQPVKIVVSLPLGTTLGKDAMDSMRLAFEQADYTAGSYKLEVIERDGGTTDGIWSNINEKANAEFAAADPLVVAYLGPQHSAAAKISMPILNRAGVVQVSAISSWPGLTKSGFLPGEPAIFYPTGIRHYFRLVAADDTQGPVGALWAKKLGYKRAFIIDDNEAYGQGAAGQFRKKYNELGLTVIDQQSITKETLDYKEIAKTITKSHADLVYYGGLLPNGFIPFLQALHDVGYRGGIMGPHGIWDQKLFDLGPLAEGIHATSPNVAAETLNNQRGIAFRNNYVTRYGHEPGIASVVAFEAANVIMEAIAKGGHDRTRVREAVAATHYDSMFGPISFDKNGDITERKITTGTAHNGKFDFIEVFPYQ